MAARGAAGGSVEAAEGILWEFELIYPPPPSLWPVLLFELHSNLNTGLLRGGYPPWFSGEDLSWSSDASAGA